MKLIFPSRISNFYRLMSLGSLGISASIVPVMAAPQEVCVKTSSGDVVCGMPVAKTSSKPKLYQSNEKEALGLFYSFKGCKRFDSVVKCNFTLTSKRKGQFHMAAWGNKIIDTEGKSYPGSLVDIGGRSDNRVVATIEPGINYALVLTFKDVPEQVTTAPLLKLNTGIQYSNVSMSN